MTNAKNGDTVKVHYTGQLVDGSVFDSSQGRDPLEFTIGEERLIPAFENAIVGMEEGETKTTTIPAEDAYGPWLDEAMVEVDRSAFPDEISPEVGLQLQLKGKDGQPIPVLVTEIQDDKITLDANHPLAGKDLTFQIELVGIES